MNLAIALIAAIVFGIIVPQYIAPRVQRAILAKQVVSLLNAEALICTEAPREVVELDGTLYRTWPRGETMSCPTHIVSFRRESHHGRQGTEGQREAEGVVR